MARHYLDHASTSPLRPEARAAMAEWDATGVTADPGRVHTEGRQSRDALEHARRQLAGFVGVRPRQVVFTSGATEAVASATWGALWRGAGTGAAGPVAMAGVEHSAVRDASARLAPTVAVEVGPTGRIEAAAVAEALDRSALEFGVPPALVHCQWANHEVGTVHAVEEVVALCRSRGLTVHVDAVVALGRLPVDLGGLGADLVSLSAHKIGGPPGAGALVVGAGRRFAPLLVGGEQERGRRAGLENVPAALGFGAVADALGAPGRLVAESERARRLTDRLRAASLAVGGVASYGDPAHRVDDLVCVGIDGVEAEPVLLGLDRAGIAAHSGSSCSSESLEPSPVLAAMGADAERSLRLSVGWSTTDADVDAYGRAFPAVCAELRALRT